MVPVPFRSLRYCVDDMEALKDALIKCKYAEEANIKLLVTKDETALDNVRKTLQDYETTLKANDNIFIAFAGHGISFPSPKDEPDKKDYYFCCSDARVVYSVFEEGDRFIRQGLLPLSEINDILDGCQCNSKIIVTDACRNILQEESLIRSAGNLEEGVTNSFLKATDLRGVSGDMTERQNDRGFFRIASCSAGEVSHEQERLKHGVFTYNLIQGLQGAADTNGDGKIALLELVE